MLEEFLRLPDPSDGRRYELHDGEVILVRPPRPVHVYLQSVLVKWLTDASRGHGRAAHEFPYRPARNLQFWYADVAYLPNSDWLAMRGADFHVYAPPLIAEILSPLNTPKQLNQQRLAAFSGGTQEFRTIDPESTTIEVSLLGAGSRLYNPSLCVSEVYDLSGDEVTFRSRAVNRPDLEPVATAIDYAQRHDLAAVLGYCVSEKVARALVRSIPPNLVADQLRVTRVRPGEEQVEFEAYRFEVTEVGGRWKMRTFAPTNTHS